MLFLLGLEPGITDAGEKRTIGAVEEVALPTARLTLRARVDTGAALSSVDAREVRVVGEGAARSVRFTLVGDDGAQATLERPLRGWRRITNADGQSERRALVILDVCVAGLQLPLEVTLNDRSRLEHHVLLGRNLLEGRFGGDVARRCTHPPH